MCVSKADETNNSSPSTTISPDLYECLYCLNQEFTGTLRRVLTSLTVHLRAMCSYGQVPDRANTVSMTSAASVPCSSAFCYYCTVTVYLLPHSLLPLPFLLSSLNRQELSYNLFIFFLVMKQS